MEPTNNIEWRRNDYVHWALFFLAHDGLLPVFIAVTPTLVCALFPKAVFLRDWDIVSCIALGLPVMAFSYRYLIGRRHLLRAGGWWRNIPFSLAIFLLTIAECFYLVSIGIPQNQHEEMYNFMAVTYAVYLSLMLIAYLPTKRFVRLLAAG